MSLFGSEWSLTLKPGPGPGNFVSGVGHKYKICELTCLILGHLNCEEYNFEISFPIHICEKDIFSPVRVLWLKLSTFSFVRNVFYVWRDFSFVPLKGIS